MKEEELVKKAKRVTRKKRMTKPKKSPKKAIRKVKIRAVKNQ